MAAGLIGGAAVGAVFGELLRAVNDASFRAAEFNPLLKRISSKLTRMSPVIQEIVSLSPTDNKPTELASLLQKGLKLVEKCKKIHKLNHFKKGRYSFKLGDYEKSIEDLIQFDVQLLQLRDSRRILLRETSGRMAVAATAAGPAGCCEPPSCREYVAGMEDYVEKVKALLINGGEEEQVVVVSAPGGYGKTTLAKMICQDDIIRGMFEDQIFFVTASKASNLQVLIQKLFQHKGYPVPNFQNDEEAVNELESMLKQLESEPVLLVLDDVQFGLESRIQDLATQIPVIKIFVTSKCEFPRFGASCKLNVLKDQDAMNLFCHSAFPRDGCPSIPDDLLKKIVGGCGGVPLALKLIGRSLCGQREVTWKRLQRQWSNGRSIFDSEEELLNRLLTSLNTLDETAMECFLDLASFPDSQRISVSMLSDMWIELYGLDEDSEESMAILEQLSQRSLVDFVITRKNEREINGYYGWHFVMQHNLLKQLANHCTNKTPIEQRKRLIMDIVGNGFPNRWIEPTEQPIHAKLVSITTDEIFSLNQQNMQLPICEVLVLNIQKKNFTLPQFMENMEQLKVLIITNYGFCLAEISNFPRLGHFSGLKRITLERISVPSVRDSIFVLKNLRKISLVMCELTEAFHSQVGDMLPKLEEIDIAYCSDLVEVPAWLCHISCLKKLSITNCHELVQIREEFTELENLEVLRLHACTKLLKLPETIGRLKKLGFIDLSDCISVSELPEQIGELCSLREINTRGCRGLSELPFSVNDLDKLEVVICDEEIASLWEDYTGRVFNPEIVVLKEDANLDWLHDLHS